MLAWVSERVAADLRNATYTHLQRLSLEFFGGKRTGDLIARVSSDTEKINIFLSVHLLDFANDVLMIVHDGGHHAGHRFAAGPGHALPAAADRLAGAAGAATGCGGDFNWGAGPGRR